MVDTYGQKIKNVKINPGMIIKNTHTTTTTKQNKQNTKIKSKKERKNETNK